ncbi:MAG: hypothetical protein A3E87_03905 [Gammaproteobacteria bacterium RIFCSPHIGHO2_12_FULL_35_23]|nr:MAG: hypothetical protein A3E87_03905 [Gammaproteobacteria bacterium RIFCSPHIGHO2_12_FULL_35_23]
MPKFFCKKDNCEKLSYQAIVIIIFTLAGLFADLFAHKEGEIYERVGCTGGGFILGLLISYFCFKPKKIPLGPKGSCIPIFIEEKGSHSVSLAYSELNWKWLSISPPRNLPTVIAGHVWFDLDETLLLDNIGRDEDTIIYKLGTLEEIKTLFTEIERRGFIIGIITSRFYPYETGTVNLGAELYRERYQLTPKAIQKIFQRLRDSTEFVLRDLWQHLRLPVIFTNGEEKTPVILNFAHSHRLQPCHTLLVDDNEDIIRECASSRIRTAKTPTQEELPTETHKQDFRNKILEQVEVIYKERFPGRKSFSHSIRGSREKVLTISPYWQATGGRSKATVSRAEVASEVDGGDCVVIDVTQMGETKQALI